jgi:glycosyltransferase involved in cell wall biosynthesis
MNVTVVMPLAVHVGGAERALWNTLMLDHGGDIRWHVIFLEDGPLADMARKLGVTVDIVPAGRLREPHKMLHAIARIAGLLRSQRADVVLSWMTKAQLYGGPAARLARVPAVWFQHGLTDPGLDRMATRLPARGILVSSRSVGDQQARFKPVRPMHVVPGGVDLERFDPTRLPTPAEARSRLGLPATGPLVGIVGRMQRWKGMHTVVEAMPRVLRSYPEAHAVLVGGVHELESDYPAYVTQRVRELGLEGQVTQAGAQDNVPEWMQAMDIVIHASDREPFGVVVVEGMALGKPVIAGAEGGPAEIIADGVNGLLAPYGDAAALATAILRYLDDPEFAQQAGAAGRRRASDFSTRMFVKNVRGGLERFMDLSN